MNGPGHRLQVALGILLAKHVAMVGVDEDVEFLAFVLHHELGAAPGIHRWQVLLDSALGIGRLDPLQ